MKKQVVFIEPYQTVMIYKMAKEFRKRGYETILIRILEPDKTNEDLYKTAYNKIIDMDLIYTKVSNKNLGKISFTFLKKSKTFAYALKNLFMLKPYVVIGRAPLSTPLIFFKTFFRNSPFIYFPYDIRSQAFETFEDAKKVFPVFEIKADRYCFENSDGLLHKGGPDELNYISGRMLGDNIKLPDITLSFQPYCSDEFIIPINKNKVSKDGKIHFVYIGGTGKPSKDFYYAQFSSLRNVLDQKIHIHMYFSSDVNFSKNQEEEKQIAIKDFYETYKKDKSIKYFHIHDSLGPKEIIKEISQYDFGMFMTTLSLIAGIEPKFCTGNKISSYLEAGIPFFYRNNYEFINKLMKKYDLDFVYPEDFKDLPKIVKKINKKQMEKNVIKAREAFNINKHFPRLEEFVKQVVSHKREQQILKEANS